MARLIIPCAGFGTRMNMKQNESKELLINPKNGLPLIKFCLDLPQDLESLRKTKEVLNPLVITRKEKTDLIDYCKENRVETLIIEPTEDLSETILKSEFYWEEKNILILPDTTFSPRTNTIRQLLDNLDYYNASFALHKVQDYTNWGIIDKTFGNSYVLTEKPSITFNKEPMAWGLIGFKHAYAKKLFYNLKKGRSLVLENCNGVILQDFQDLTRTGEITS